MIFLIAISIVLGIVVVGQVFKAGARASIPIAITVIVIAGALVIAWILGQSGGQWLLETF